MNNLLGLIVVFLTLSLTSTAQSFSKIWYFGNQAGLDFRSGSPVPFRSPYHRFYGGNVMEADANGNVILYTNGSDRGNAAVNYLNFPDINLGGEERIFDRSHLPIANSDSLFSIDYKSQPCVLLKKPGPDSLYYLFSPLKNTTGVSSLSIGYSIIHLNSSSGFGQILSQNKANLLVNETSPWRVDALITQSPHANGRDYWVIAIFPFSKSSNSVRGLYYYSFILNSSGLQLAKHDSLVTNQRLTYSTTIRFNHRGDKAAMVAGVPNVTLLNFNNATGSFGSFQVFNTPTLANALSFSSNDSLLYVGIRSATPANSEIRQFKVFDPNPNSTVYVIPGSRYASRNRFSNPSSTVDYNNVAGMQLGPDGKLYIGRCYSDTLDVIHNPDVPGAGCGYQRGYLPLGDTNTFVVTGFIQFPSFASVPPRFSGCAPLRVNFANPRPGGLWYEWRFVDDSTFSSSPTPVRTYTRGGQYGVVLRVGLPGGQVDSSFFTVMVYDPPSRLYRFKADTVCLGATSRFSLDTLGLQNLRFRVLLNGTPLPEDSAWFYHARLATPGTHTVRVIATNTFTQCQDTTDYPLVVRPKPTALFVLSDSVSCVPASLPIQVTGSDSAWVLSARLGRRALSLTANTWRDTLAYANATHDTLRLVRTNSFGCSDTSAAKPFHVLPRPIASFTLSDTESCGFVYVRLLDSSRHVFGQPGAYLQWEFGDGSPPLRLNQPSGGSVFHAFQQSGVFNIRLIAFNGRCTDTLLLPQTITITPAPQPGIGVVNQRVDSTSNNGRLERSVKGCVPFTLQLTDLSQGARDSVRFYHNNQPLSSLSLNFSSAGNHTITQRVYGSTGCITTDTLRITISPKPSLSSLFTDTLKSCGSVRLRLRAGFQQTDSVQLTWSLPGGTSTTQQSASNNWSNLSSTITQSGTVQWTMRLMATGCEDTASRSFPVSIRPQTHAGILPADTLVCFGKQAQLQNTTTQADSLWLGTQAPGSPSFTFLPANSTSFQPTLTTSGIWRFQLATSSAEGCRDTTITTLRVLTPLSFTYQYRDSAICGRVIRTLSLQSSDSLTLSEGGVPKGRFGPNSWRFELSGTDSLKLRVNMANARCDSTANLTIGYQVRPAARLTFRTDSLRACLPFNVRLYLNATNTDSLFWQTTGGWNVISPLPDSNQRPFNWSLPFTLPYNGPLQLRFSSVEGCTTDTLVGNLALKARPTLLASLSPSSGCKPLEAVLSVATTNTDSLLIRSDSLNLLRLNPTSSRFNLRFWSNDRLTVTATNGVCATDTSLPVQISGFDNRPGLRLTATRADSVGGKEQIRLFWEALPMRKFYRIEVSADSVNWRFLTDQTDNSWTDPLSDVTQPWWYKVTAYDSCGNAAYAFRPMRHLALSSRWTSATQERIQLTSPGTELSAPIQLHRQLIGLLPLRQDSVLVSAPLNREEGSDWQLGAEEMSQLSYLLYYLTQEEGGHWRRSNTRIDTMNSQLYLPTSFTPNGDGLNEVLRPIGIGLSDIRMEVWNRWGEKVYEGSGPNTGWNGHHQGQPASQGHYLIRLQATTTTGQPLREEKSVWLGR